jgi:hypothetical protein
MTTDPIPTPNAPVPPDELINDWRVLWHKEAQFLYQDSISEFTAKQAAAWGYKKAMQGREELAELLMELVADNEMLFSAARQAGAKLNQPPLSRLPIHTTARARAAAERLRGGES